MCQTIARVTPREKAGQGQSKLVSTRPCIFRMRTKHTLDDAEFSLSKKRVSPITPHFCVVMHSYIIIEWFSFLVTYEEE